MLKISFSKEEFSRQSVFQKRNFGENVKMPSMIVNDIETKDDLPLFKKVFKKAQMFM